MKTGSTIDRLDRATMALADASSALGQLWASDSRIQFVQKLEEALGLLEEVLTKSEKLTPADRERLGYNMGVRLLGLAPHSSVCMDTTNAAMDRHQRGFMPCGCPLGKAHRGWCPVGAKEEARIANQPPKGY